MLTRRILLASSLALVACGKPAKPAATGSGLRVATYRGGIETYTAASGLAPPAYPVTHAQFVSGNLITEAINAGAIDLGTMSDIPPVFLAQKSAPLRLIAVIQNDVANQVVLVPKDSQLKVPADLRGKRIGYVRATTSQFILLRLLEQAGLTLDEVKAIALAPQDGRAAFERGDLDAWIIFGPIGFLARQATGARVFANGVGRLTGNFVYATSAAALDDPGKRASIADYLRRTQQIFKWTEAHENEATALVAKATGVAQSVYLAQRRERSAGPSLHPPSEASIASQQQVADTFFKFGAIPAQVNVRPLWARDFDYHTA